MQYRLIIIEIYKKKSYNMFEVISMTNEIRNELELMTNALKDKIQIEKVILFGSQAYGNPKEDSDIDLCIITEENKRKIELIREIRKIIKPYKTHSMDILVYNLNEFTEKSSNFAGIEKVINEKGVLIYG